MILAVLVTVAACASPGVPPGGPPDVAAPQIVRIAPDSGRAGVTPREVIFRFDETVSERPTGAASLEALFLISPRDGSPVVDWNREELAIRPRRGWRKNTTYTITMLPGMSDLRGNVRNTGAVTIFSTGSAIPQSRISGTIFNWAEGAIAPRALIEVISRPDTSLVYVAAADSLGQFSFPNLMSGAYTVRGFIDNNSNRGLDSREAWDSVAVTLTDSSRLELLAFVHDSVGPRVTDVSLRDSVTLELTFDSPILLQSPLMPASVTVRAPDSAQVRVVSVAPPARDSTFASTDVTPVPTRARPSKPAPHRSLVVSLGAPLSPGIEYRVRAIDIRNLIGVARSSERTVTRAASVAPAATPVAMPPGPTTTRTPPVPIRR